MKDYLTKDKRDGVFAHSVSSESTSPENAFMDEYFQEIEKAKGATTRLKEATVQIKDLQDIALSAIGTEAEHQVSEKLAKLLFQTNRDAVLAKKVLEDVKKATEKMDRTKLQADIRVRESIHATCLQNLVVTVRAYQQAQQEYKVKLQEKATRQIRVVKPDATNEEIIAVIRSGDVNAVYREALLQPGADPIAQTYLSVADKYQDVLKLERSVIELHMMFQDLAVLVEAQGEMLDNIEYNVRQAGSDVKRGVAQIKIAMKARKQTRRRTCCFFICLGIIMLIILGPVLGVLA